LRLFLSILASRLTQGILLILLVSPLTRAQRDLETLVVVESLTGTIYAEALVCLEAKGELYLPVTETAQALGVSVYESKPQFLKIEVGDSFVEMEFPDCQATEIHRCPARMSRKGRPYLKLSEAVEQLKWPLQYDPRRLALLLQVATKSQSQLSTPKEPENIESVLIRDFSSKPQTSLQISYDSKSQGTSGSMGSAATFLSHDFWVQHRTDQVTQSPATESETFFTMSRTSQVRDLLGPLEARHYKIFRIQSPELEYISRSRPAWGLQISSFDQLGGSGVFSKRTVRGRGQPQWKVELFLNGIFLAETFVGDNYEYEFENVPVYFGVNSYSFVFTSPLGQKETRDEVYRIDSLSLRPGELGYRLSSGSESDFSNHYAELSRGLDETFSAQLSFAQVQEEDFEMRQFYWIPQVTYSGDRSSVQFSRLQSDSIGGAWVLAPQLQWGSSWISSEWVSFDRFQSPLVNPSGNDFQLGEKRISTLTPFIWGSEANPSSIQFKGTEKDFRDSDQERVAGMRLLTRVKGLTYALASTRNLQTHETEASIEILKSQVSSTRQISYQISPASDSRVQALWNQQVRSQDRLMAGVDHSIQAGLTSGSLRWARDWKAWGSELKLDFGSEIFWGLTIATSWVKRPVDQKLIPDSQGDISSAGIRFLVFVDENLDGNWSTGEERVPLVRIRSLQSQREYTSDENGVISVSGLAPYVNHSFEVALESIPNLYLTPVEKKIHRLLTPTQIQSVAIPLASRFDLKGLVRFPSWKRLIPLILKTKTGEVYAKVTTNQQGEFRINDVPAGTYTVEVDSEFLRSTSVKPVIKEVHLSGPGGVRYIDPLEFALEVQERQ
jgi:hypothetical protein